MIIELPNKSSIDGIFAPKNSLHFLCGGLILVTSSFGVLVLQGEDQLLEKRIPKFPLQTKSPPSIFPKDTFKW